MVAPSGRVLTVGAGQQFSSLKAAVTASQDGDLIQVQAGTYTNDYATVTHAVTIQGVGGLAHFHSTGMIPNDKAILIDQAAELTIQNLEFSGAQVWDANGAGIRYERGNLVVQNSYFHDNQDGILGGAVAGGNVTIDGSSFVHNGAGDGQTHGVYLGHIARLAVTNSFFQDQLGGSHIKSRADATLVQNNKLLDTDNSADTTNYQVDLPEGGNDTVDGNVMIKSTYPNNRAIIHFGGEVANPIGTLLVQNNQFYSGRDPSVLVRNQSTGQQIRILNNGIMTETISITIDGDQSNALVSGSRTILESSEPSTALVIPTVGGSITPPGNIAPFISVPGNQSIANGSSLVLPGISIADADGASQSFTVTLTATDGLVSTSGSAGGIAGNGSASVTLTGSLANMNADLAALTFKGTVAGAGSLRILTSDGAGGSDTKSIAIAVTAPASAPSGGGTGGSSASGTGGTAPATPPAGTGSSYSLVGPAQTLDNLTGNNVIDVRGAGGTINVMSGRDTVTIQPGVSGPTVFNGYAGDHTVNAAAGNNTLLGGTGNNVFSVTGGNNLLAVASGNSLLTGFDGNNTLMGGAGSDTLSSGGSGTHTLVAGSGKTVISAAAAADWVFTGSGQAVITLGSGSDSVLAAQGQSTITATAGQALLGLFAGNHKVALGSGSGTVFAFAGSDTVAAGGGTSISSIGGGSHLFALGAGHDTLFGGGGSATITGGSGDAVLALLGTNAQVTLAGGHTTLFAGTGALTAGLGSGEAVLLSGSGNATLTVQGGRDTLFLGGSGNITINNYDPQHLQLVLPHQLNGRTLSDPHQIAVTRDSAGNLLLDLGPTGHGEQIIQLTGVASVDLGKILLS